jgi:hypothetical protein
MQLEDALLRFDTSTIVSSEAHRYDPISANVEELYSDRKAKYPHNAPPDWRWCRHLQVLDLQGYVTIPNFIPLEQLSHVREHLESALQNPASCKHVHFYDESIPHFTKIKHPLIQAPSILPIAVGDKMSALVSEYFGCIPLLGAVNLRKSYVTGEPPGGNQLYHVDQNTTLMLKVFFYLHDVDISTGPFMYVRATNHFKHPGWEQKYIWSHKEIIDIYGIENTIPLTAKAGDAVLALTHKGFHCGLPPTEKERSMLTLNYMIHPETRGTWQIGQEQYNSLTPTQQCLVEAFERI